MEIYNASGKLMLMGEYLVLNGADCLAIPLKMGQTLSVFPSEQQEIHWKSYAPHGLWFSATFDCHLNILTSSNQEIALTLQKIFQFIQRKNKQLSFFNKFVISTDFELDWGLGSSSTLISVISQWAKMDAFALQQEVFGGSGYDVACATATTPILFNIHSHQRKVQLSNSITEKLLFVYSGKKQNSRDEIQRFQQVNVNEEHLKKMNQAIQNAIQTADIAEFETQLDEVENLLAERLETLPIKSKLFSDYPYSIKSLGAWGGDFFMATYRDLHRAKTYFSDKGYSTFFTYSEIIYSHERTH